MWPLGLEVNYGWFDSLGGGYIGDRDGITSQSKRKSFGQRIKVRWLTFALLKQEVVNSQVSVCVLNYGSP